VDQEVQEKQIQFQEVHLLMQVVVEEVDGMELQLEQEDQVEEVLVVVTLLDQQEQ
jgi:hypothetical protein